MKPTVEHFIDTSVLLESLLARKTEERRFCERYLARANKTYRAVLGSQILGEFADAALRSKDPIELFNFLQSFIEDAGVRIIYPNFWTVKYLRRIHREDDRIDFMDAFHLACARQKHVERFVSIDSKLVHNEVLEKLLEMRIMHPKELI